MAQDQGRDRFDTVPDEVRLYVRGGYGEIAGHIDPNLYDRITRGQHPITERPGALVPPALDNIRKTRGPFTSDDDVLLAAFYDDSLYGDMKNAGPIQTDYSLMETPLLTLVRELSERPEVSAFHFIQKEDPL